MPRKGRNSYNTLDETDTIQYLGETEHRQARKSRHRKIGACIAGAIVLCLLFIFVLVALLIITVEDIHFYEQNSTCSSSNRVDCAPEGNLSQSLCEKRGCCWDKSGGKPQCYYPSGFGYGFDGKINDTLFGYAANLKRKAGQPSQYGGDVDTLRVDVMYETQYRLRIKIYDPNSKRYEVPMATPKVAAKAQNTMYEVEFPNGTFGFNIKRGSTGTYIFSTGTGFIFADQFLQLSALLPTNNIYGLGEHVTNLKLNTNYNTLTLFTRDVAPNPEFPGQNLYGVHPFYMCLESDGIAHGVFLLNSNAMEVALQPAPSITYRTIGGILDFYFFLGPSPEAVVQQYTEVIGRPYMPSYWSLGFHLCRWGYKTANETLKVVESMREKKIPQDTQWNDIDYMHSRLDFTYDNVTFGDLPSLVADLHNHSQKYVVITDPGISNTQPKGYLPFDEGVAMDIFITNSSGQPIIGKVWPNDTAFPDFTNPLTEQYWLDQIQRFHDVIGFDGLWIDMNEPSNFVAGSVNGCPSSSFNSPPFLPGVIRNLSSGILEKTLCMTANQNVSQHYDVHSLYGLTEANHTMIALNKVLMTPDKHSRRSLVISRSTYPGSGTHGGHWLGDNASEWPHMANSIPGMLDFSLFGIPLVGADICGFHGDATEQLCIRWQQLGAFYPFSRNHNSIGSASQEPIVWSEAAVTAIREALLLRYQLLPFLYTLFHYAHINGSTVARPLLFEFPDDSMTWDIDAQFMWGDALLISPVLTENATTVKAYFPSGRWFDFRTGSEMTSSGYVSLDAPLSTIPLHVRGGSVIPMQEPSTTTAESRKNPFALLVALDKDSTARGQLFLDDGETVGTFEEDRFSLLTFNTTKGFLDGMVEKSGYSGVEDALLTYVTVYGLDAGPSSVSVNGETLPRGNFTWNDKGNKVLNATVNIVNLNQSFNMTWN